MKIMRKYGHTGSTVLSLAVVRDYLNQSNSRSLGSAWGHKVHRYWLHFGPDQIVECASFGEVEDTVERYGDTRRYRAHFESITGRLLKIDATTANRIVVEADNKGGKTIPFIQRVEELLKLQPLPRRVFVTHGQSKAWIEVARFIDKETELHLESVELAEEPNKGRTVIDKLIEEGDECSYAVIVMTGDDFTTDDQARARENVIHELGYFQGRYGRDRICILHEVNVNIPSNLGGVVYYRFPKGNVRGAFADLQKELRQAFPVSGDEDVG